MKRGSSTPRPHPAHVPCARPSRRRLLRLARAARERGSAPQPHARRRNPGPPTGCRSLIVGHYERLHLQPLA